MEKFPNCPILIVDDEPNICLSISATLASAGLSNTLKTTDPFEAMNIIKKSNPGIVLLDLNMPEKDGKELLKEIIEENPETFIIVISGQNELSTAVECMKNGAYDYLLKPVSRERLISCVNRAVEISDLRRENTLMRHFFLDGVKVRDKAFSSIITANKKMLSLFQYCEAVAGSQQAVMITGETGAGKELFAKAIHELSGRSGKFIAVNLAGLDPNIFSDTLFGHLKGAFTGADKNRKGLVEEAEGGTLFLDEIGDLNKEMQIKLLRLLQEREYSPLGSDVPKKTTSRIIVATHKDLNLLLEENKFRKDLYFRLKTHHIHIPPLRERNDDISLLLDYFLEEAAKELKKKKPAYPPELITLLKTYHFPGNIRELRAMVYDALSGHKSMMLPMKTFRERIHPKGRKESSTLSEQSEASAGENSLTFPHKLPTLKNMSDMLVQEAMKRSENNQSVASGLLGISQQALSKRLKKLK